MNGLRAVYRRERNFRWMVAGGIAAVAAVSLTGPVDAAWWRVTTVTALVLAAELGNSALEAAVDLAEPNDHPVAGYAKDAAAGAVLLLSVLALVIAVLELWPRVRLAWDTYGGPLAWAGAVLAERPAAAVMAGCACALAVVGLWRFRSGRPRFGSSGLRQRP